MPNGHMAGRGSDVTSALTVLLSSRDMFLKLVVIQYGDDDYSCRFVPSKAPPPKMSKFHDQIKN